MKPHHLMLAWSLILAAGCSDDDGPKPALGTCQQRCSETAKDCPASTPICTSGTCVQCTKDGDCSPPYRCNTKVGRCNYCESDADCGSSYTACNLAAKTCAHCTKDGDCMTSKGMLVGTGKCSTTGVCDGCSADTDCAKHAKPYCSGDRCSVECKSDADCGGLFETPYCDTVSGSCIGCTSIGECNDAFDIQLYGPYHCI